MATKKLTNDLVDKLQPHEKDYFVWDSQLTGFGVRVSAKGKKTWIASTHKPGKARPSATKFGDVDVMGLKAARDAAREMIHKGLQLKGKEIPQELEDEEITFGQAVDIYMKQLLRSHGLDIDVDDIPNRWPADCNQKRITFNYARQNQYMLNKVLVEGLNWENKPLKSITRRMIYEVFTKKSDTSKSGANLFKSHISSLYRHFQDLDVVQMNPTSNIKANNLPKDPETLTREESLRLQEVLKDAMITSPVHAHFLLFMLAGGTRVTESMRLRWFDDGKHNYVDIKNKTIVFRQHKTDEKSSTMKVALTDGCIDVLNHMIKHKVVNNRSKMIFYTNAVNSVTGHICRKHTNRLYKNICLKLAKEFDWPDYRLSRMTQYKMRHTFATLNIGTLQPYELMTQMKHKNFKTTQGYIDANNNDDILERIRERTKAG